jgi:hypothetical protein
LPVPAPIFNDANIFQLQEIDDLLITYATAFGPVKIFSANSSDERRQYRVSLAALGI